MDASRYAPHRLGRTGERLAEQRLSRAGWTILERNYRSGRREVDLVISRPGLLAFVEVKTRSGTGYGPPEVAVTRLKRREIERVAREYLARHGARGADVRFDVVAVEVGRCGRLERFEHIEDAWRPGWD